MPYRYPVVLLLHLCWVTWSLLFFSLGKGFITGWAVCPTAYSDLSTIWLTLLWTHPLRFELILQHTCTPWHSFYVLIPLLTVSIIAARHAKTHLSVFAICIRQHFQWLFPQPQNVYYFLQLFFFVSATTCREEWRMWCELAITWLCLLFVSFSPKCAFW